MQACGDQQSALRELMMKYPELVDCKSQPQPEYSGAASEAGSPARGGYWCAYMTDVSEAVRLFYSGEDEITRFKEGSEQYPVTMQFVCRLNGTILMCSRRMIGAVQANSARCAWKNVGIYCPAAAGPATFVAVSIGNFQVYGFTLNVASGFSAGSRGRQHTVQSIKEIGLPPGYSYRFTGQVKVLEGNYVESSSRHAVGFHFYVHGIGRAVREFLRIRSSSCSPCRSAYLFALLSLWITGRALSLWSALGMFLLLGIVKKKKKWNLAGGLHETGFAGRTRGCLCG